MRSRFGSRCCRHLITVALLVLGAGCVAGRGGATGLAGASGMNPRCADKAGREVDCQSTSATSMTLAEGQFDRSPSGWNYRKASPPNPVASLPRRQIEKCSDHDGPTSSESSEPFMVRVPSAEAFCRGAPDQELCRRLRVDEVLRVVPTLGAEDQFIEEHLFYQAYSDEPVPDLVELTFRPKASGPHQALTRVLSCKQYPSYMMCTFHSRRAIFDVDLDAAFAVGDDVSIETGLALARAYSTMQISEDEGACLPAGIKKCRPPIRAIRRCGPRFVLDVRSRECTASLLVTVSRVAWWTTVRLEETPYADNGPGLCCELADPQCDGDL